MSKKKEKRDPRYIIYEVNYGTRDIIDCMKAIIKRKLDEDSIEYVDNIKGSKNKTNN